MKGRTRIALAALALALGGVSMVACEEFGSPTDTVGGGANLNAGGGAPPIYQGAHQAEVHHLLNRVSGWRTSQDAATDAGVPPSVAIGNGCMRDTYVAAAVMYAWAAESYYRLRHPNAASMAGSMRAELNQANQLCSSVPGAGGGTCRTLSVWGCPAPM